MTDAVFDEELQEKIENAEEAGEGTEEVENLIGDDGDPEVTEEDTSNSTQDNTETIEW